MTDRMTKKDRGPVDEIKEKSGIYMLGFERESFFGLVLPIAFTILVGGGLGIFIWKFL